MPKVVFDPAISNPGAFTYVGGLLTCVTAGSTNRVALTDAPLQTSGKFYFEFEVNTLGSFATHMGIAKSGQTVADGDGIIDASATGYGLITTGQLYYNNQPVKSFGTSWTTGDRVSILIDIDANSFIYWKNGTPIGTAYTGLDAVGYRPAVTLSGSPGNANFYFAAADFLYTPTAGYVPWPPEPLGADEGEGAPTLSAWTCAASEPGGEPTLSAWTSDGVGQPAPATGGVALEALTFTGEATNSFTFTLAEFEGWTAQGTSLWGSAGAGAFSLAAWTAQAYSAPAGAPSLEPWTASGEALNGRVGQGAPQFKALTIEALALGNGAAAGAPTLRRLRSAGEATAQSGATAAVALRRLVAAGSAIGGSVAAGAALFKALTADVAAYGGTDATAAVELPKLVAAGVAEAALDATLNTWVMNTRTNAVTAYPSYPANSFARYNGTYLAAGPTGLFDMQGADSDGVAYEVGTGAMDEGKVELKRLVEILVAVRYDTPVRVTVTKDAEIAYEYSLASYNPGLLHQARVKTGKGMRSRHFKVGMAGEGRFELDSMQVNMPSTSRRVG